MGAFATLVAAGCMALCASASAAPYVFVTNQGNFPNPGGTPNVGAFTIGAGGSLTAFPSSPLTLSGGGFPYGAAVTPDNRFMYVGDQVSKVYPYSLSGTTATPGTTANTGSGSEPSLDLVTPDGKRLYTLDSGNGEISGFSIASDGSLSALPGSPYTVPGTVPTPTYITLTPNGSHLYVAGFGASNKIAAFNVAADGSLSNLGSPIAIGSYTNGLRITPNGQYLYASNQDATTPLSIYAIQGDGSLSAVVPAPTPAAGDATPAISPDGQRLYVGLGNGTVDAYTIAAGGTLTPVTGSPFTGLSGHGTLWDLEFSSDGKQLYADYAPADDTADGALATFDVVAGGGLSLRTGSVDTGGTEPWQGSMTVSPDPGPAAGLSVSPASAGSATSFNAASSHATVPLYGTLRYDWSFGDGSLALNGGATPSHVYAKPGSYTATVQVTDGAGCSAALVWTGMNSFCAGDGAAIISQTVVVGASSAFTIVSHKVDKHGHVVVVLRASNGGKFKGTATFKVKRKGKNGKSKRVSVSYGKRSVTLSSAGTITLKLGPSGVAKRELAHLHNLLVALKITFSPSGVKPLSHTLHVRVKRNKHGKFS